jgi:hypothetical protein
VAGVRDVRGAVGAGRVHAGIVRHATAQTSAPRVRRAAVPQRPGLDSLGLMNAQIQAILDLLRQVDEQRAQRAADPALALRVRAIKHYQHERFQHTYADLLALPRFAKATRFFLEELYGPADFTRRDTQFKRVVPGLVRLFPHEVVLTVQTLGELHALSETLDTAMGRAAPGSTVDLAAYAAAWQAVGRPAEREQQIALMRRVGDALDGYTRNPLLRHSLRLMRGPARLAGLPELQAFLEAGFDTFRQMRGAKEFLDTVVTREREIAALLFRGDGAAFAAHGRFPPVPDA